MSITANIDTVMNANGELVRNAKQSSESALQQVMVAQKALIDTFDRAQNASLQLLDQLNGYSRARLQVSSQLGQASLNGSVISKDGRVTDEVAGSLNQISALDQALYKNLAEWLKVSLGQQLALAGTLAKAQATASKTGQEFLEGLLGYGETALAASQAAASEFVAAFSNGKAGADAR